MLDGDDTPLRQRVSDFVSLYNEAEKVYKSVQNVVLRIDAQVHNEFRYCARGLAEFLAHKISDNGNDYEKAIALLSRADHAARNALNDSIDLLVAYAKTEIQRLASIDTGRPISSYYTDFGDVKAAITRIESKAELTRQKRDSRLEEYIEISGSTDFEVLKKFCKYLPYLDNEISVEYGRRVTESRRFWFTVFLALISIVVGLPGFSDWASKQIQSHQPASLMQPRP